MGRPRQTETREVQRNFRFTLGEDAALRRRAELAGQTVMEFGRAAMLAGMPGVRQPISLPARSTSDIRRDEEIRRLGVNLNQLMRWLNAHPDEPVPADLPPLLAAIRAYLQAVLTDAA